MIEFIDRSVEIDRERVMAAKRVKVSRSTRRRWTVSQIRKKESGVVYSSAAPAAIPSSSDAEEDQEKGRGSVESMHRNRILAVPRAN